MRPAVSRRIPYLIFDLQGGSDQHTVCKARWRIALCRTMQMQFMDRAPFAMLLQQNAVAVLGKGVTGFKVGPMPDYTHYAQIKKT
jgi:hypothetical protein